MRVLYRAMRSLLFRLDPERAHRLALAGLAAAAATPGGLAALHAGFAPRRATPVRALGLTFPNRVGLAAGWDKDGLGWRGLAALGLGHVEVGTVTPEPQPGNPKPRVFRLPEHRSLINRMGFPGDGAAAVAARLGRGERPYGVVLGVNIGKQKTTALDNAAGDYEELVDVFAPLADYLAVNISSPNTPGLRRLQEPAFLGGLLGAVATRRDEVAGRVGRRTPVLVKLAPDLEPEQLRIAVDAVQSSGLDGIIATNTTLARDRIAGHPRACEEGGLSGATLTQRARAIVAAVRAHAGPDLPIVGAGGVMSAADAEAMVDAGATLVQLYTGLIYAGPGLVREVAEALSEGQG